LRLIRSKKGLDENGSEDYPFESDPMQTLNLVISSCRHCHHYSLEGRRGGQCQQLDVPVQGSWKSCQLAIPPFSSSWDHLEELIDRQKASEESQITIALECNVS
jgi:hypothetical protein